jgi:hypothetical protein
MILDASSAWTVPFQNEWDREMLGEWQHPLSRMLFSRPFHSHDRMKCDSHFSGNSPKVPQSIWPQSPAQWPNKTFLSRQSDNSVAADLALLLEMLRSILLRMVEWIWVGTDQLTKWYVSKLFLLIWDDQYSIFVESLTPFLRIKRVSEHSIQNICASSIVSQEEVNWWKWQSTSS